MRANWIPPTLLTVMVTAGCWRATEPRAEVRHDPEKARLALIATLDAWKQGKAQSLARGTPPIRFVDEDVAAGWKLADYEIEEPDAPIHPYENVAVILSLRDTRGKTVRRETHYQVTTDPALAVLRSDP